jgi:integrase
MSVRRRIWTTKTGERREAWVVAYTDQSGSRHIATFERKRDAGTYHTQVRTEVRAGVHTAPSTSTTVAEAFRLWIEHGQAEGLEFGTIRQRRQHLRLHITPFIGHVKLSDLTVPQINEFLDQLREAGRSIAMRRKVLTNLKTAIGFAQSQGSGCSERCSWRAVEILGSAQFQRSPTGGH